MIARARGRLSVGLLAATAAWTIPAAADNRERDAVRLFDEARALQRQGQFEEACARFDASERLDPAVGTLLNLAECAERAGATASAWHRYRQAAALAVKRSDAERHAIATRKGDAAEARLSKLVLRASTPLPASATVWRDGDIVLANELGSAIPVDPGDHRVTVRAPGFEPWTRVVTLGPGPATVEIELPALETAEPEPSTRPAHAVVPAPAPAPAGPPSPPPPRDRDASRPDRTLAVVVGGAGVAALVAGSYFALRARSLWVEVDARCPRGNCPDQSTADAFAPRQSEAARDASVGTVALVTGGVAVLAAAGLYFLTQSKAPAHADLARTFFRFR